MGMSQSGVKHEIIGFDAREAWLEKDALWDAERTRQFLPSDEPHKPLSADTLVWPSLFDVEPCLSWLDLDPDLAGFEGLDVPEELGINRPLWQSLWQLRECLQSQWRFADKPYSIVAICRCSDEGTIAPTNTWPYRIATSPGRLDETWRLLGFDVAAKQSLLSGLSNCGYTAAE